MRVRVSWVTCFPPCNNGGRIETCVVSFDVVAFRSFPPCNNGGRIETPLTSVMSSLVALPPV